jgi:hypothetical protein
MQEIFYKVTPKDKWTFGKENSPIILDESGWKTVVEACLQLPGVVSCELLLPKLNRIRITADETFSGNISLAVDPLDLNSHRISQNQLLREKQNAQKKMYAEKIRRESVRSRNHLSWLDYQGSFHKKCNTIVINDTNIKLIEGIFVNSLPMSEEIHPGAETGVFGREETSVLGLELKWPAESPFPVIHRVEPNSAASRASHLNPISIKYGRSTITEDCTPSSGNIIERIDDRDITTEGQVIDLIVAFAMGSQPTLKISVQHETVEKQLMHFNIHRKHISEENIYYKLVEHRKFQIERDLQIKANLQLMSANAQFASDLADFYRLGYRKISDMPELSSFSKETTYYSKHFPIELNWIWAAYVSYEENGDEPTTTKCPYCRCPIDETQPKSFSKFMLKRNSHHRYLTEYTQHPDYHIDIGDLLRYFYRVIA